MDQDINPPAALKQTRGTNSAVPKVCTELKTLAIKLPAPLKLGHYGGQIKKEDPFPLLCFPSHS